MKNRDLTQNFLISLRLQSAFFASPDLTTARTRRFSSKWPGLLKFCDTGKLLFVFRFFRQSLQSFQHEFSNISLKCVDDCRLEVQSCSLVCFVGTTSSASTASLAAEVYLI